MRTIRTYQNLAEAGFAKSLLQAAGIDADLPHEFAATSSPEFAVWGVKLQVPEQDVDRAIEILDGNAGLNPDGIADSAENSSMEESFYEVRSNNNPYAILILACPFLLGGLILVLKKNAAAAVGHIRAGTMIDPPAVRDIGIMGLVIGGALILVYFYILRELRKDSRSS
jgi:uncharacterized integral membrane protein